MKFVFVSLALLFTINIGLAQSPKIIKKANHKVEKLNLLLTSVNPDLALTDKQRDKIYKLELQKILDNRKINKSGLTKEEKKIQKKAINKKTGKQIRNEILTKEQRIARKTALKKFKKEKK